MAEDKRMEMPSLKPSGNTNSQDIGFEQATFETNFLREKISEKMKEANHRIARQVRILKYLVLIQMIIILFFGFYELNASEKSKIIACGKTLPGNTMWQFYKDENGRIIDGVILVFVDTSKAKFSTTPLYFTSLTGNLWHSGCKGTSSIYKPTANNFVLYLEFPGITPEKANSWKWYVNWMGVEE